MKVVLHTNFGDIELTLDTEKAPISCKNFMSYVEDGFYDGTIFHRVIPGFMAQGGGFTEDMTQKDVMPSIQNEADNGLDNDEGTVAMARTNEPHSATAQFFINVSDNGFLNHSGKNSQGWGYAVFAKVTGGMDVVKKIESVKTGTKDFHQDVPTDAVTITSAEFVEEK